MTKKRCLSIGLTTLSILMLLLSSVQMKEIVSAASPPPKTFTGYIPSAVKGGQAYIIRHHLGTDQLSLAIGLPLRNQEALTQLLNEVSTPHNPQYRHYLTQAQVNQAFNPTPQQEQQVISWMKSHGLTVTQTYPNHLLVDVTGTFAQIEQAFHVTINDYSMRLNGKSITFYAPANEPTVDGSVGNVIETILGLDDYPRFQVDASPAVAHAPANGNGHNSPPYYPQDFANAYDVNPVAGVNGWGLNIGVTLWGPAPSDKTLFQFHHITGASVATRARKYGPRLNVITVDKKDPHISSGNQPMEAGMDVEYTSGIDPYVTIDYYEAPTDSVGNSTDQGLEDALNMAGSDGNHNAQISNSWGGCEATSLSDPFTMQTEQILLSNTATGHNYFFGSGDSGSACSPDSQNPCNFTDPAPFYPASSAYVTSVGGTTFKGNIKGVYPGEVALSYTQSTCILGIGKPPVGSGGGYSNLFDRPGWQIGFLRNSHRGYPDVAADADPNTGALICYDNNGSSACIPWGGTSLATPLWAGMMADVNQYLSQFQNGSPLGFVTPMLYEMNTGMTYSAYHDIKQGINGYYKAGKGWDAVTGLGSPDLYNLALDAIGLEGLNGSLNGVAAVSTNDVWAVGTYGANDSPYSLIEQWNGSTWNTVSSSNTDGDLMSVAAVSANDIWAVGYIVDSNNNTVNTLIEQWNGSTWNVIPSPNPGPSGNYLLSVAAVSVNDIWAVGFYYDASFNKYTLIEQWNGSTWNVVPSPNPASGSYFFNELSSVAAVSPNDVWAVGTDSNSSNNALIEQWNGSNWIVVSSPNPGYNINLSSIAAVSPNDIWVSGYHYDANDNQDTLIEQWNGSTWNVVPSPNRVSAFYGNELSSVATISANDVWTAGYYYNSTRYAGTLIEQWNGSNWKIVRSPSPAPYSNELSSVSAVSTNDVWAVGYAPHSYYGSNALIEQWNGSTWNVVPSPNP